MICYYGFILCTTRMKYPKNLGHSFVWEKFLFHLVLFMFLVVSFLFCNISLSFFLLSWLFFLSLIISLQRLFKLLASFQKLKKAFALIFVEPNDMPNTCLNGKNKFLACQKYRKLACQEFVFAIWSCIHYMYKRWCQMATLCFTGYFKSSINNSIE
jgi:hypothetical protein